MVIQEDVDAFPVNANNNAQIHNERTQIKPCRTHICHSLPVGSHSIGAQRMHMAATHLHDSRGMRQLRPSLTMHDWTTALCELKNSVPNITRAHATTVSRAYPAHTKLH